MNRPARAPQRPGQDAARTLAIYGGLVAVPVAAVIAVLLLAPAAGRAVAGRPGGGELVAAQLLVAVAAVTAACALTGALARRLGQPAVIGEITAGILLGPSVLGALWPAGAAWLLPPAVLPGIDALAQVGVVLFVFLAGLEVDLGALRGRTRLAVVVSHVGIAVPLVSGVGLALAAHRPFAPPGVGFQPFALFLSVALSVTALPVLARILRERGLHGSEVGVIALTCTLIDDVTAWCLLALVVALATASSSTGVLATVGLTALFACALLLLRPLLDRLLGGAAAPGRLAVPAALTGLLAAAAATEAIGVHAMFGAFLFGLAIRAGTPAARVVADRLEGLTAALLLPLFFAASGLRTEIGLLGADPGLWAWCALVLLVAVSGKLGGAAAAARLMGMGRRQSLELGALLNCRGLTELVVLNVGLDLGVLSPALFTIMVITALVSTAMTPPLLGLLSAGGRRPAPAGARAGLKRR